MYIMNKINKPIIAFIQERLRSNSKLGIKNCLVNKVIDTEYT